MATAYDSSKDNWAGFGVSADGRGSTAVAITPSDTVDLNPYPKHVIVSAAGDIKVLPMKNTDGVYVTFASCPVGFVIPIRVRRVQAAGTNGSAVAVSD